MMLMSMPKVETGKRIMNRRFVLCILLTVILVPGGFCMQKKPLALDGQWKFRVDSLDHGIIERWYDVHFDRSQWVEVEVPNYWERYHGMALYDGAGWFARTIEVKDISQPLSIFFGGIDDDADVWINGLNVGNHAGYSDPFSIPIDQAVKIGLNEIVVRVQDFSGPGGIYKPVTIIPTGDVGHLLRTKYASMEARKSPEWVSNAVIYEVYLRSFSKEGTFKALEARIPELQKLGVTVVWLMPIHPVGKQNRKGSLGSPYSVQDYYAVNPEFGTLDDFKSLVRTIHHAGLKIIIDLVANHTAWDNPMLKEHPAWYTHDASGKIIPPNPDWTDVADLNYDLPDLRTSMITMMKYWVRDIGIDGYRCDVAELVPLDFWESARIELDAIKPVMMLSEGTLPEHHIKAFDLTYSWNVYDVFEKVIKGSTPATIFHDLLKTESNQFPRGSLRLRFNTNHDKNAYDGPAVAKFTFQGAKATAALVFTYPGVPLIYNGEEVGNDKKLGLFEKYDIDWSKNIEFMTLYEKLSLARKLHPALVDGSYTAIQNSQSNTVLSFMRAAADDSVVVVINFKAVYADVDLMLSSNSKCLWKDYFTGLTYEETNNRCHLTLPSMGFVVLSRGAKVK
jgi:cyclomaltodextrinase / maltogenic alpha-amylase / neopullulanase